MIQYYRKQASRLSAFEWMLRFPYSKNKIEQLKRQFPSKWDATEKVWYVYLSGANRVKAFRNYLDQEGFTVVERAPDTRVEQSPTLSSEVPWKE
jgi:hypothetical protein